MCNLIALLVDVPGIRHYQQVLATEYTFGGLLTGDHRIITVCQKLTRNIGKLFDDILEEITQGFTDFIDAKGEGKYINLSRYQHS